MKSKKSSGIALEKLLRRGDVWRGDSQRFVPQAASDTGHPELNAVLLNKGWPLAGLVEVCQPGKGAHSEWLLAAPALNRLATGYVVLLNPPHAPFAQGLHQLGLDLNRLIVVQAENTADFLLSFVELARAEVCAALLAWQPKQGLRYAELRKCLLATRESAGLNLLFRPTATQEQSSPAPLRLSVELDERGLQVCVFKQKGWPGKTPAPRIHLPLPVHWMAIQSHPYLDRVTTPVTRSPPFHLRWSKP